jgi:hypothetical protein
MRCIFTDSVTGIIIKDSKSPVKYMNQTGGHCVDHPEQQGFFIPLCNPTFYNRETEKREHLLFDLKPIENKADGIKEKDADLIDRLFKKYDLPLKVDRELLHECAEAWLHVVVHDVIESHNWDFINVLLEGDKGIFVYENSD